MEAEAAVSSAVQILGDLLIQKINFLRGVEDEVRWLKDELQRMQSFLRDADEKQADDERVRRWVSEIRELARDAQDGIEIFALKVESAKRSKGLLARIACFPNYIYHINKVGKEIDSIRKRLREIESGRQRYRIRDLGEATGMSRRSEEVESMRRLAHWQKDRDMVGLERDVELLLKKLILDEREVGLCSATVVGMGGIGKSTLARRIYNHDDVAARFEFRGWVVVSGEFRPREVIKELMLQLLKPSEKLKLLETMEKFEVHDLLQMLHQRLQGKRYFIVVDDVWEDKHWEAIAGAFPDEAKGSKMLLTSRNRVTTKYTRHVHPMKLLDSNESWVLFLKKAFIDNTDIGKCPQDLENIGRQILRKCNGLPLAISVVGGLLAKQRQSWSEWEKVLKGINSHLGRSGTNVLAILELSYQNLPPKLKPCFLSLAFFKEDATIPAQKLVHIWIALGFIPQEGEESMEETAISYLDELINRNMVQVKDMKKNDEIKNCQMHDLIRELCITKAKEEMSFEILREEGNFYQSSHKSRHRVVSFSKKKFVDEYSINQNKHLRSLFVHGGNNHSPSFDWKSFLLLRVLDLEGCPLSELPNAMFALTELRYLGMRRTRIYELPRLLGKLKNLEVLDLRGISSVKIPNVIWKLDSLRHLYSDSIWSDVPLELSTLKNIQTLSWIPLQDSNLEQVTHMINLCKLGINMNKISSTSRLFSSLAKLENLIHLHLSWVGFRDMEGLSTLHHITRLILSGLKRLPSVSAFPPNLSYLTLSHIELSEDPMPVLEKLPKLLYLKLMSLNDVQKMVISPDGFPKLKVLCLMYITHLRNIEIGKGAMSSELKRLEINGCLSLERLPEEVKAMSNLEQLKMVTTTGVAAKLRGEDSHIIAHIPSVHLIGDRHLDFSKRVFMLTWIPTSNYCFSFLILILFCVILIKYFV